MVFTNRLFKLWNYSVSHSTLIMRSEKKYPDQSGYNEHESFNIDIEFDFVEYIDIPRSVTIESIKEIKYDLVERLMHYSMMPNCRIFEISTSVNTYYVAAHGYTIGINTWDAQDRISDRLLQYDEIIELC